MSFETRKCLFRTNQLGAGHDSSGNPTSSKETVIYELSTTSYTAAGEPLVPNDLGLRTIDDIQIRGVTYNDTPITNTATTSLEAHYAPATGLVFLFTVVQSTGAATIANDTEAATIRVTATGDSQRDVELR